MGRLIDEVMWYVIAFSIVATTWASVVYGVKP